MVDRSRLDGLYESCATGRFGTDNPNSRNGPLGSTDTADRRRGPFCADIADHDPCLCPVQRSRRTLTAKEVVALVAIALLVLIGLPLGIGGVLIMLGLGGLLVGGYAVVRGRSRLFRLRSRLMGLAALGVAFVLFGIGGAAYGGTASVTAFAAGKHRGGEADREGIGGCAQNGGTSSKPSASVVTPGPGSALAALATLPVRAAHR